MILLTHGNREYLRAPGAELHTDLGMLTVPEDVESGAVLETHLGEEFVARELRGPDLFNHLERTGAPMMPRDIGLVIGHTGTAADDRILDAGTGTGVLSAYLGRLGASVTTYERSEEFAEVARQNMRVAGVDDCVDVHTGDVTDDLPALTDGEPFDLLTLDTEDAPEIVESAPDLLAYGGYVVVYSPFIENSRKTVAAAEATGLSEIETIETIQREMTFDDRGSRPSTKGVGHTGYLTIARNS